MGRPPLVDRDVALDAIMRRFWRTGYAATSLDDLLDASGMHRGSFYRAFGDKHGAFAAALERYADVIRDGDLLPYAEEGTARERLTRILRARVDTVLGRSATARDAGDRPGCLAMDAALELGPHEPETRARVGELLGAVRTVIAGFVADCVEEGTAPTGLDVEAAADQIMTALAGVTVLAGAGAGRERLLRIIDHAVATALLEVPR